MAELVMQKSRSRSVARSVLIVLAHMVKYTDPDRQSWPTIPQISKRSGWGESAVAKAVIQLEEIGSINVTKRSAGRGKGRDANLYHVLPAYDPMLEADLYREVMGEDSDIEIQPVPQLTCKDTTGTTADLQDVTTGTLEVTTGTLAVTTGTRGGLTRSNKKEDQQEDPLRGGKPPIPITFPQWVQALQNCPDDSKRNAVLAQLYETLFPKMGSADYGRLGKLAKQFGAHAAVLEALWEVAVRPPNSTGCGELCNYLLARNNTRKNTNGTRTQYNRSKGHPEYESNGLTEKEENEIREKQKVQRAEIAARKAKED